MIQRFIAFVWDPQAKERTRLAGILSRRLAAQLPHSTRLFESPGLRVFERGSVDATRVYKLERNGGIVLGRLFKRSASADVASVRINFSATETERVQQSGGRHLIEHYWGRYVAFIKEDEGPRVWVIRDPSGAVLCQLTNYNGISVFFSNVDDCAELGLIEPTVNWEHIGAYLYFDRLVTAHTGLTSVRQVHAGECIETAPNKTRNIFYWRPDQIFAERRVEDRQIAMQALREVIHSSVAAWASGYDSMLHELSGGLDSAIVLACLSRVRGAKNIICENHFSPRVESDERIFALEAARSADVKLVETPIPTPNRSIDSVFGSARHTTPSHLGFVPETQYARSSLLNEHAVEVVFSGRGGDHFFQRGKTPQIASDYVRQHGLGAELTRVISETCRFTGESIWTIIGAVFNSGLLRRKQNPYEMLKTSPLLSQSLRNSFKPSQIRHPWIDFAADLPGGKQLQVFNIIDSQMFHQLPDGDADIVHPLISQPIIELCLQIPSYVLTYGGIDRALVRDAFAGIVPADILARTSKGATTGYFTDLLIRNIGVLREYLLDGRLVAEGLLERRLTEDALSERAFIRDGDLLFPVLDAFRAEYWLRSWNGCTYQALT